MKKQYLLIAALAASQIAMADVSLESGFEGASLAADGWTEYSSGGTSKWAQISYSAEAMFKSTLKAPASGGAKCVKSTTGGLNAIGKVNPSSWLISPKVKVGKGESLSFLMAYNAAYNGNALVTSDDNRSKFDVLISTTTADTTAFSEVVYHKIHKGLSQYANYCIDLSKYEGKEVYIAFHEYGTPTATPWITNVLYLDNVKLTDAKCPDLSVVTAPKFKSGLLKQQDVTFTVKNFGVDVQKFKLNYRVGSGSAVTEVVDKPLASGDTLAYTFSQKALFPAAGEQEVKVWCDAENDGFTENDADSVKVKIYDVAEIPYVLTETSALTDFASSYSRRSGKNYYGWAYYDNTKAWVYTKPSGTYESYLYSTKGFALKKGKLRIKTTATATATPASMRVYLTKVEKEFGNPVATVAMKTSLDAADAVYNIDVPEDGEYIIAFQPDINGQVALFGLELSLPMEDMVATEVTSPASSLLVTKSATVSAKFRNDGEKVHKNVKVSYQFGDAQAVTEEVSEIAAGAEVEYTFAKKLDLSAAGSKTLKVWSSMDGDGNVKNDTVAKTIFTYEAKTLPFSSSFETGEDALTWATINVDNDDVYWGIEPMTVAIDGKKAMYLNTVSGIKSNDYAVSPALSVKKGEKYRLSFYYAKASTIPSRISTLKVYLATSADAENIVKGTLLADFTESESAYRYANEYFTVPEDGIYYIAFQSENGTSDLIIDDFRIDQASELVMTGAKSSVTDKDYELADGYVTATFVNAGMTDLNGVELTCVTEGVDAGGKSLFKNEVNETCSATIAAGDTVNYTFKSPVKFDKVATYKFTVALSHSADADAKNNSYVAAGPTLFETKSAPVVLGFEDAADNAAVKTSGKWLVSRSTPYQGSNSIYHSGKAADGGDWIYLNRINIPAGTYDFSFFWKTMTGNNNSNVRQSFAVYLGTSASADGMTTKLAEFNDTINSDHKATKELLPLVIDKTDNYFIGIKCTTANSLGSLVLDQFAIANQVEGKSIPVGGSYDADFATREGEWYHYHPTNTSSQWTVATADGEKYMTTKRSYVSYMGTWTTPGIYESPAFKFAAGDKYEISYEYSIAATDSKTPLDGKSALNAYIANRDLPSAFTGLAAHGGEDYLTEGLTRGIAKDTISIEAGGIYYFGFVPSSEVSAQFNLYSFKLANLTATGVDALAAAGGKVALADGKLVVTGDYVKGEIYSVSGLLSKTFANVATVDVSDLSQGIYIVRITTESGVATAKIVVR